MKKLKKKILSVSLILLSLTLSFRGSALAQTNPVPNLGEDVIIGEGEVIEGPYIKYSNNVTISGTVNGDVFVAGSFVTIDGKINGDLIVGGGAVLIKGEVTDDVRAGGGMVTIDGKVGKNVTALAGTVTLGSDADVDGNVLVVGNNFAHLGNIDGKLQIYANEATLAGRIGKNVEARADRVAVLKMAILDRNLLYTSDKEASVSAEARIVGTVKRTPVGRALTQIAPSTQKVLSRVRFRINLLSYFSMLLLGLILLKIAPRQVTAVSKLIGERPWYSLGLGLLALVLTPIVVVILVISVIGIPLAAILVVLYILMISLSSLFTGLFIGQKVFDFTNLKENRYVMLASGLLLLQLVLTLPVVGGFIRLLSILAAMGAMLTLKREALKRLEVRSE